MPRSDAHRHLAMQSNVQILHISCLLRAHFTILLLFLPFLDCCVSSRQRSCIKAHWRAAYTRALRTRQHGASTSSSLLVTPILLSLSFFLNIDPRFPTLCLVAPCLKHLLLQAPGQDLTQLLAHGVWPLVTRRL